MFKTHGGVYYIAHPKTGSTSAASALTKAGWEHHGTRHSIEPYAPDAKIISVVRNPMDWLISWYHYKHNTKQFHITSPEFKKAQFKLWIPEFTNEYQIGGLHFYGVPLSTHIIFQKDLQRGWDAALDDVRRVRITLTHENVSKNRLTVSEYFDAETEEIFFRYYGSFYQWYQNLLSLKGNSPIIKR
jgi:hypothetical protein